MDFEEDAEAVRLKTIYLKIAMLEGKEQWKAICALPEKDLQAVWKMIQSRTY